MLQRISASYEWILTKFIESVGVAKDQYPDPDGL